MNKFITQLLLVAFATPATFAASEHAFAQEDQLEQPMKKRSKKKRSKKKRSKKRKKLAANEYSNSEAEYMQTSPTSILGRLAKGSAGITDGISIGGGTTLGTQEAKVNGEVAQDSDLTNAYSTAQVRVNDFIRVLADFNYAQQTVKFDQGENISSDIILKGGPAFDYDTGSALLSIYGEGIYGTYSETVANGVVEAEGSTSLVTFELGGTATFKKFRVGGHWVMGAATEFSFGDDEQGTTTQEESIPSSFGAFGQFQVSKMLTAGLYLNSNGEVEPESENETPSENTGESEEESERVLDYGLTVEANVSNFVAQAAFSLSSLDNLDLMQLRSYFGYSFGKFDAGILFNTASASGEETFFDQKVDLELSVMDYGAAVNFKM